MTKMIISTVNIMMLIYSRWCTKRNVVISFTVNDTVWRSNHEISIQMTWYVSFVNEWWYIYDLSSSLWCDRWIILYNMRWGSVISEQWCCSFDVLHATSLVTAPQLKFNDIASDAELCNRNDSVSRHLANQNPFGVRLETVAYIGCLIESV